MCYMEGPVGKVLWLSSACCNVLKYVRVATIPSHKFMSQYSFNTGHPIVFH
jgi:hypothetical protein